MAFRLGEGKFAQEETDDLLKRYGERLGKARADVTE